MSRKNVVDVTFLLVFSTIFRYQPIRCSDLIEVLIYVFSPFNRFCQVPAYLLRGSLLKLKPQKGVAGFHSNHFE